MKFLVVKQTSQRRFVAHVQGDQESLSKGTSLEFAVGRLIVNSGFKYGVNVMPESEIWAWAIRNATRCATPIKDC